MPDSLKKYQFKLLREQVSDADAFESKTHENIATTLFEIIQSEEEAITIGLEGPWGAGKSTVIALLKAKFAQAKDLFFYQFDAWAHEGDPLRRVFLESLIDELNKGNNKKIEALEGLKAAITGRSKTIRTSTNQKTTTLARLFAVSLLFVPLGSAFLGKVDYDNIVWYGDDAEVYLLLVFGFLGICLPAIVLLGNWIRTWFLSPDSKRDAWRFMQSDSLQETVQDITEERDQTSIEFERFFQSIVNTSMAEFSYKKIVLVIDNLDRIAPEEALKIWAVLQTFLQQRNQAEPAAWFDNVWVIVPYDYTGLMKLWKQANPSDQVIGKSFFDKSFQLRLDVPKPIFKDWEGFAKKQMDIALVDWEQKDRETILRILRIARSDLNDIPTPREIKNYINQVALIARQRQGAIPLDAIAYYVNWREILNTDTKTIREKLLEFQLAQSKHFLFFDRKKIIPEIAALCFGVSLFEANRFLLSPPILNALISGNESALGELAKDHESSFWAAFENLKVQVELPFILTASKAIYLGLWEQYSDRCDFFLKQINHLPHEGHIEPFDGPVSNYSYWIRIAHNPQAIYEFFIRQIENKLLQSTINWKERGSEINATIAAVRGRLPDTGAKVIAGLDLFKLVDLAQWCKDQEYIVGMIHPPQAIAQEFIAAVKENKKQLANLNLVIRYLRQTGQEFDWNALMEASSAVAFNAALDSRGNIFLILLELSMISPALSQRVADTVRNINFYAALGKRFHPAAAFVWSLFPPKDWPKFTGRAQEISAAANQGVAKMRTFWTQENEDSASAILRYHETYGFWKEFWPLTKKAEFLLVRRILRKLVESESLVSSLKNASIHDVFENLQFKDADIMEKLVRGFYDHGSLEVKLLALEDIRAPFLTDVLPYIHKMEIATELSDHLRSLFE